MDGLLLLAVEWGTLRGREDENDCFVVDSQFIILRGNWNLRAFSVTLELLELERLEPLARDTVR